MPSRGAAAAGLEEHFPGMPGLGDQRLRMVLSLIVADRTPARHGAHSKAARVHRPGDLFGFVAAERRSRRRPRWVRGLCCWPYAALTAEMRVPFAENLATMRT